MSVYMCVLILYMKKPGKFRISLQILDSPHLRWIIFRVITGKEHFKTGLSQKMLYIHCFVYL